MQTPSFDTVVHGAKLILNNSVITSPSSSVNGVLWQGIECKNAPNTVNGSCLLQINGGTIQYASSAYTQYDPALGFLYGFGRLYAQHATFRNNIRCLDVGNSWYNPTSDPDSITWIGNYVENSSFLLTADFPYTPPDMIYENGSGLICHSCTFQADYFYGVLPNLTYNFAFANNTTAIRSLLSITWLEQAMGNTDGCTFTGFKNGLVMNNAYSGFPGYNAIISNAHFWCVNALNISGSMDPLIVGNLLNGPIPTTNAYPFTFPDYCAVFLRNCPSLRVEGNRFGIIAGSYHTAAP